MASRRANPPHPTPESFQRVIGLSGEAALEDYLQLAVSRGAVVSRREERELGLGPYAYREVWVDVQTPPPVAGHTLVVCEVGKPSFDAVTDWVLKSASELVAERWQQPRSATFGSEEWLDWVQALPSESGVSDVVDMTFALPLRAASLVGENGYSAGLHWAVRVLRSYAEAKFGTSSADARVAAGIEFGWLCNQLYAMTEVPKRVRRQQTDSANSPPACEQRRATKLWWQRHADEKFTELRMMPGREELKAVSTPVVKAVREHLLNKAKEENAPPPSKQQGPVRRKRKVEAKVPSEDTIARHLRRSLKGPESTT